MRGDTVMSGYLDAPELNRLSFVDGWLRTGDIGSLDAEGFLTLHGRLKDLINRGGEKIAPLEIDSALLRHSAVAEAAAYAVPHPRLGEDIAAAVVLHPGCTVDPSELREFLGTQLAASKIPRRIVVLDQLPRGAYDKVLRRRLSENSAATDEHSADLEARWHAQLLQLWNKFLKTTNLTIDDDFFEKGGDSLLALDLHVEIERLTGVAIPESILYEASTVRGLAKRLAPPPHLGLDPVVHGAASKSPLLFFVDEGASTSSLVKDLTDGLEPEQPLIVISAGVISDETRFSIYQGRGGRSLVADPGTRPDGSFRLGGHGNGALVAFETARLLVAGGKNVGVVAMVDPPNIATRSSIRMFLSALAWPKFAYEKTFLSRSRPTPAGFEKFSGKSDTRGMVEYSRTGRCIGRKSAPGENAMRPISHSLSRFRSSFSRASMTNAPGDGSALMLR